MKIFTSLPVVLACLSLTVAPAMTQGDDCSSAQAIAGVGLFPFDLSGMTTSGLAIGEECSPSSPLNFASDGFFAWSAPADGAYFVSSLGTPWTVSLAAYSGGCAALQCLDSDAFSLNSRLDLLDVQAGQLIWIQLGGLGASAGQIEITTHPNPCTHLPPDGMEPNDSCAQAPVLGPGSYSGLQVSEFDEDFFAVTVGSQESIVITPDLVNGGERYRMRDENCNIISFDSNAAVVWSNTSLVSRTLFLSVEALGESQCVDYGFTLEQTPSFCAPFGADVFEPNNDPLAPIALTPGTYLGGTVYGFDVDYFSISLPPQKYLVIEEIGGVPGSEWDIAKPGGGLVSTTGTRGGHYFNDTGITQDMLFWASLHWSATEPCIPYSFTVSVVDDLCLGLAADPYEDNDGCDQAIPVLTPGVYSGLTIDSGDPDTYRIDVPSGQTLHWSELSDTGDVRFRFTWGDQGAACGSFSIPFTGDALSWTNPNGIHAASVFIGVSHNQNGPFLCSEYAFDLMLTDDCDASLEEAMEFGPSCSAPVALELGRQYEGHYLSLVNPDFYRFCVEGSGTLTAQVDSVVGSGELEMYLWPMGSVHCGTSQAGQALASAGPGAPPLNLTWTNPGGSSQEVVLEVRMASAASQACNLYDLLVQAPGSAACSGVILGDYTCHPALNNSTGLPARLLAFEDTLSPTGVHLDIEGGPPGEFGYILIGTGLETVFPLVISDGLLCLSVNGANLFARYNNPTNGNAIGFFDSSGRHVNLMGSSNTGFGFDIPVAFPHSTLPDLPRWGGPLHFQAWYRDSSSGSDAPISPIR